MIYVVSIQILQYEFLGPIPLSEWGPPMGKLLYLILYRDKDRFNLLYVGDCEHTDDKGFFIQHEQFGCWAQKAGSDSALYLAVLPLGDSDALQRKSILRRIVSNYRPPCNPVDILEKKPSYNVRRTDPVEPDSSNNSNSDVGQSTSDSDAVDDVNNDHSSTTPASSDTVNNDYDDDDNNTSSTTTNATTEGIDPVTHQTIPCPCCGSAMLYEKNVGEDSALYRCKGCGMSDTRLE